MTIAEFIEKKEYTFKEFSEAIGVSVGIVRLWDCRAAAPRLKHALRISKLSKGKVKMTEMLTLKDQGEFND